MELRVDIITIDDQLGLGETQNYVKKINIRKKWNLDSKVNKSVSLTKRKNIDGVRLGNGLKHSEAVRIKKWVWLSLKVLIPRNLLVCNVRCSGHWMRIGILVVLSVTILKPPGTIMKMELKRF